MSTILVAGATGYLGRFIVAELHRRGYQVRALVRDLGRAEAPGIYGSPSLTGLVADWRIGDVTNPHVTADLAHGVAGIISALGVTRQKADPWDIDYRTNLAILNSARRHGVNNFCYVHALGAEHCPARITVLPRVAWGLLVRQPWWDGVRFAAWSMTHDSVGESIGRQRLLDFYNVILA